MAENQKEQKEYEHIVELNYQDYHQQVSALDRSPHLTSLIIQGGPWTSAPEQFPSAIAKMTNLKSLVVSNAPFSQFPEFLADLTRLEHLETAYVDSLNVQTCSTLATLIHNAPNLKTIKLQGFVIRNSCYEKNCCNIIIDALLTKKRSALETFEVGESVMEAEDLAEYPMIPIDIRRKGFESVVTYLLDLIKEQAERLFRSKIMVVGYEEVGKTTLLGCLFPLAYKGSLRVKPNEKSGLLSRLVSGSKQFQHAQLIGGNIELYATKGGKPLGTIDLAGNGNWRVEEAGGGGGGPLPYSFVITQGSKPTQGKETGASSYTFSFDDLESKGRWYRKIEGIITNQRTHGIDVETFEIDHPLVTERLKGEGKLELSVWDFAGQHEYYNSHQYFLQARSVFLVVWKIHRDPEVERSQMERLDFWLKSLSAHLPTSDRDLQGKPLFSIKIVATHVDSLDNYGGSNDPSKRLRERRIHQIVESAGFRFPVKYHEVSCRTGVNIKELQEDIYQTVLEHGYMGELVPLSYLEVEEVVKKLKSQSQGDIQLREISEVLREVSEINPSMTQEVLQRAINLLSAWGICCYFDAPSLIADVVVLDPSFLTKDTLAKLFQPNIARYFPGGVLPHRDLAIVFPVLEKKPHLAPKLMAMLEKFEVCFEVEDQSDLEFNQKSSIITALLPNEDKVLSVLDQRWPAQCPYGAVEVQQYSVFNVIPKELVSRLLVRLNVDLDRATSQPTLWRTGVYFDKNHLSVLMKVDLESNRLCVTCRGTDRSECIGLLRRIVDLVRSFFVNENSIMDIGKKPLFPGVTVKQAVESPESRSTLIDLDLVLGEYNRDPGQPRKLKCPATRKNLNSEEMMVRAGLLNSVDKVSHWWTFPNEDIPAWEIAGEVVKFHRLKILEEGEIRHPELCRHLTKFLGPEAERHRIRTAYAISHPVLQNGFDIHMALSYGQVKAKEKIFKKDDWKKKPDAKLREEYLKHFDQLIQGDYPWKNGLKDRCDILPVIHSSKDHAIWSICESGFAKLSTLDDGYYGKGLYFTNNFDYAKLYSDSCLKHKRTVHQVFVVAVTIPGNPFPVTEHPFITAASGMPFGVNPNGYHGKGLRGGYQSHYTIVKKHNIDTAFPVDDKVENFHKFANELVLFENIQALPIFTVELY